MDERGSLQRLAYSTAQQSPCASKEGRKEGRKGEHSFVKKRKREKEGKIGMNGMEG